MEKSWRAECGACGKYLYQVYRTGKKIKLPCDEKPKCKYKTVRVLIKHKEKY